MDTATFDRRALLGGAAALSASLVSGRRAHAASRGTDLSWGRIANGTHRGERIYTGLFFAGPQKPASLPLYTRHPLDSARFDWRTESDIWFLLQHLKGVGLNTIKLSYFGHDGETDDFSPSLMFSRRRWPQDGTGTYTDAEQIAKVRQLFRVARGLGLLIAPMIEVGVSFNPFFADFPFDLNELLERATYLLTHFAREPNYLRVSDKNGRQRHVVWLIESIHAGAIDPVVFAAGFDRAAALLEQRLGIKVGFMIDPTPLPAYGPHDGPQPAALRNVSSLLGINPFNITSQGPGPHEPQPDLTHEERLAYARHILLEWSGSGIPCIAACLPGFDSRIVRPEENAFYGYDDAWLTSQRKLVVEFGTAGISVDTCNGFTEGYAIYPTVEDGNRHAAWMAKNIAAHRAHWI